VKIDKKIKLLLLLALLFPLAAFAQVQADQYSIQGKINLLIGLDIVPAREILVTINNKGLVATTDSLGSFRLDNLKQGKYELKVIGDSFSNIDTTITIVDKPITSLKLLAISECGVNQDIAQRDISNQKQRLLLAGGIAPVMYIHQDRFEKKYNVLYDDFGCLAPNHDCIVKYNKVIFKYLDSKYGKKWRKEVRKDVIGL
jgi:hypothetical protein